MAQLKTKPGDMIAIPTYTNDEACGFVIARHIGFQYEIPLFEVFRKFYKTVPFSLEQIDSGERLFRPILVLLFFGNIYIPTKNKWPILFHDANYHQDQSDFKNIQIGYPDSGSTHFDLWQGGAMLSVGAEEVNRVENATWWTSMHLSIRVAHHLAGLVGPFDQYDVWRIYNIPGNESNRPQLEAAFARDINLSLNASSVMQAEFDKCRSAARKRKK